MEGSHAAIGHLTVKERVLLHLLDFPWDDPPRAPTETTQPGLAAATAIERRHVPQYVRPMVRAGLVEERRAWVLGNRQRVRAYALTPRGRSEAMQLRNRVLAWTVEAEGPDGSRGHGTLGEFAKGSHRGMPLLRLVESAGALGYVPRAAAADAKPAVGGKIEMLGDAPCVEGFVGRADDLEEFTSNDAPRGMVVVHGVAGIGKSWLAAEACARLHGSRNLFWHRIQPWDGRASVLFHLGQFLAALGRPTLRAMVTRDRSEYAADVLARDLPGTNALLVFDDAHIASSEALQVFRAILDMLPRATDVAAILLSRSRLPFYDRRDVAPRGALRELHLEGLEPAEALAYLTAGGRHLDEAPWAGRGLRHPLLLELARANPPGSAKARTDIRRFLEESILTELTDSERKMMGLASLYQVPVPSNALFLRAGWDEDILLGLRNRELLRPVGEDRYEAHDLVRDFFEERLTPRQRAAFGSFAARQLNRMADEARDAKRYRAAADFLANAVRISPKGERRAAFEEARGDTLARTGDLLALSVAYRQSMRDATSPKTRRRLHRKLAQALADHGALDAALAEVGAASGGSGALDVIEAAWGHLIRARVANRRDRFWDAEAHARRSLLLFRRARLRSGMARASLELAYALSVRGKTDRGGHPLADRFYENALRLAEPDDDPAFAVRVHMDLASRLGQVEGNEAAVLDQLAAVEAIPDCADDPFVRLDVLGIRSWVELVLRAEYTQSEVLAREAIRLAEALQDPVAATEEKITLSGALRGQERIDEACALWEEVAAEMRRLGYNRDRWLVMLLCVGECKLIRADRQGWDRLMDSARASGIGLLARYPHGAVLEALDRLLRGEFAEATALFRESLRVLRASSTEWGLYARLTESGIVFWYAVAMSAMGRSEEASVLRDRALEVYRARNYRSRIALAPEREREILGGIQRLMEPRDARPTAGRC